MCFPGRRNCDMRIGSAKSLQPLDMGKIAEALLPVVCWADWESRDCVRDMRRHRLS